MSTAPIERGDGGPDGYQCGNCRAMWKFAELEPMQDLGERVESGGTVPSGECPECGALCYPASHPAQDAIVIGKATPGPWRIGDHPFDIIAEEYRRVATVAHDRQGLNRGREESEANARLIAAAPELLGELDPDGLDQAAGLLALVAGQRQSAVVANLREKARRERALLARIEGTS